MPGMPRMPERCVPAEASLPQQAPPQAGTGVKELQYSGVLASKQVRLRLQASSYMDRSSVGLAGGRHQRAAVQA
eukprot:1156456-Pelagomonas_calceolata.AAC.2